MEEYNHGQDYEDSTMNQQNGCNLYVNAIVNIPENADTNQNQSNGIQAEETVISNTYNYLLEENGAFYTNADETEPLFYLDGPPDDGNNVSGGRNLPTDVELPSTSKIVKRTLFLHTIDANEVDEENDHFVQPFPDSTAYLNEVRVAFVNELHKYEAFNILLHEYKLEKINTTTLMAHVAFLLNSHDKLLQEFNTFLPPGFKITIDYITDEGYVGLKNFLDNGMQQ